MVVLFQDIQYYTSTVWILEELAFLGGFGRLTGRQHHEIHDAFLTESTLIHVTCTLTIHICGSMALAKMAPGIGFLDRESG